MGMEPWLKKRLAGFGMALLLCPLLLASWARQGSAEAESSSGGEYIAPRLPADADPYDPEHPELLQPEQLYAKSAILIEAESGDVIFEKEADERMYPASTTKVLTVLLGLGEGGVDAEEIVTMSGTAMDIPEDSSVIPMQEGETIKFKDLLFATMVRSGNEGANLIAETVAGNINDFVWLMNQEAVRYGCTDTHFMNPSGLHNNDHFTTARDMGKIARAAMQNKTFQEIAKTYTYSLPKSNLKKARVLVSGSDALLNPNIEDNEYYYRYAKGVKTGFHNFAGYCYIGAARNEEGVELISVVFYTTRSGRWTDTKKLMEYGFSQYVSMTPAQLYNQNPIVVETAGFSMADGDLGRLPLTIRPAAGAQEVSIVATRAELEARSRNLRQTVLIEYTRDFTAPIERGEVVGALTYYPMDGGAPVAYDLLAGRSIERRMNAPKTLNEIVEEVYGDPNPFPPFTIELLALALLPLMGGWILVRVLGRAFRRAGRRRKGRIPKPENRYFR
ncbi:MAG: D-alanyl-D-alanine carboxypeptidase [Clostridia bacterium]|nr:D-alanyl-D-alanine carboxypeptidase [Clostridia bacterium]